MQFIKLVQLLDKQLNLDKRLDVLNHLDSCNYCRDACALSRTIALGFLPSINVGEGALDGSGTAIQSKVRLLMHKPPASLGQAL